LLDVLQDARDHFVNEYGKGTKCIITSGNRCKAHNEVVQLQGNPKYKAFTSKSKHMEGIAADHKFIKPDGKVIAPKEVLDYYESLYPNKYGLGLYSNRVHLDVRDSKARWSTV